MISFLSSVWIGKYIPLYFHSRPIRNRLIDTALLRLFCIFNYDRAQFIFQLSPRRIANLQINRDFWYRIDSTSFHDLSFEFAFTNRSNQQEEEEDVIVRWKNTGGGERKGRIKLMTHKRVCGNRARRIMNFRRFDVAGVSAFSCGGRGERAGLSQRSKSTKFRGFICPSRMRRERESSDTHVHNIQPSWRIFMKLRGRWMRNRSRKLCDPLCSVHLERVKRSSRETLFRHVSNDLPRLRGIVSARTNHPFRFSFTFSHTVKKMLSPSSLIFIHFDSITSRLNGSRVKKLRRSLWN